VPAVQIPPIRNLLQKSFWRRSS